MSQQDERAKAAYERMRNNLFPEWDKEELWWLETRDAGIAGMRYEYKMIGLNMDLLADCPDYKLEAILVHEICHANVNEDEPGHGESWQREMEKARSKAEELEMNELATELLDDVNFHRS